LRFRAGRWECVRVAPSYGAFLNHGRGRSPIGFTKCIDAAVLLRAANEQLTGDFVRVVAVDMPLSTNQITSRRVADNLVSKTFGRLGCSTHSPNCDRPGTISDSLRNEFTAAGFVLHTATGWPRPSFSLIETFPHPALLALCNCDYRLPYKISRARRYWPTASLSERRSNLRLEMQRILAALSQEIEDVPIEVQPAVDGCSFKELEDMIDALVCAWVGTKYLEQQTTAYGDSSAAIWVPTVPALRAGHT